MFGRCYLMNNLLDFSFMFWLNCCKWRLRSSKFGATDGTRHQQWRQKSYSYLKEAPVTARWSMPQKIWGFWGTFITYVYYILNLWNLQFAVLFWSIPKAADCRIYCKLLYVAFIYFFLEIFPALLLKSWLDWSSDWLIEVFKSLRSIW